ncbi:hypothetical protein [Streptomyces albidoflavus]|uniref:hypothetical protein n=1 Tax=Streptomyces albidoflavus TaxID=1886 RepID=UPI0033E5C989
MADVWAGEKLRLRGVEPEDWRDFRELARDLGGVCAAGPAGPPRSDGNLRGGAAPPGQDGERTAKPYGPAGV